MGSHPPFPCTTSAGSDSQPCHLPAVPSLAHIIQCRTLRPLQVTMETALCPGEFLGNHIPHQGVWARRHQTKCDDASHTLSNSLWVQKCLKSLSLAEECFLDPHHQTRSRKLHIAGLSAAPAVLQHSDSRPCIASFKNYSWMVVEHVLILAIWRQR